MFALCLQMFAQSVSRVKGAENTTQSFLGEQGFIQLLNFFALVQ